jgi:hypothetical protein
MRLTGVSMAKVTHAGFAKIHMIRHLEKGFNSS